MWHNIKSICGGKSVKEDEGNKTEGAAIPCSVLSHFANREQIPLPYNTMCELIQDRLSVPGIEAKTFFVDVANNERKSFGDLRRDIEAWSPRILAMSSSEPPNVGRVAMAFQDGYLGMLLITSIMCTPTATAVLMVPAFGPDELLGAYARTKFSIMFLHATAWTRDNFSLIRVILSKGEMKGVTFIFDNMPEGASLSAEEARNITSLEQWLRGTKPVPGAVMAEYRRKIDPKSPVAVAFTSGTTGVPKACLMSHKNFANGWQIVKFCTQLSDTDAVMRTAPLFHSMGVGFAFAEPFLCGSTVVLPCYPFDSQMAGTAIDKEKITQLSTVPAALGALITLPNDVATLASVRSIVLAGASITKKQAENAMKRFPNLERIGSLYGGTESSCVTSCYYARNEIPGMADGPLGTPLPGTEIKLVDPTTGDIVPLGVPGELCAKSCYSSSGYIDIPNILDEHGFYHTGDLVVFKGTNLFLIDRIKEVIKRGGEQIFPSEIEAIVCHHEVVAECAVVPAPDEALGECTVCYISPNQLVLSSKYRSNDDEAKKDIKTLVSSRLIPAKVPDHIFFLEALPKTPTKKIAKLVLKQMAKDQLNALRSKCQLARDKSTNPPKTQRGKVIAKIFAQCLSIPEDTIGVDDNFMLLGGNSILAMRVVSTMWRELAIQHQMPPALLLSYPTIQDIENYLDTAKPMDSQEIAEKIAKSLTPLERKISGLRFVPHDTTGAPKQKVILLTGVTGHLGVWILRSLLLHSPSDVSVMCLVRGTTGDAGQRVRATIMDVLPKPGPLQLLQTIQMFSNRTKVLRGDITQEHFGLSEADRVTLSSKRILSIVHNAAEVNWLGTYESMFKSNVDSTEKLIELACKSGASFHYVSSLSTQWQYLKTGEPAPEEPLADIPSGMSGYFDTKWAAERLVIAARSTGMPSYIYRPSFIAGASCTGKCNKDDFVCRMLSSLSDLHCAPENLRHMMVDAVTVDYVADVIGHSVTSLHDSPGLTMNVCGEAVSIEDLVKGTLAFGYPVKFVSRDDWEESIAKSFSSPKPAAVAPLVPMLRSLNAVKGMVGKHSICDRVCAGQKMPPRSVSLSVLTMMINWLVSKGYMTPPPGGLQNPIKRLALKGFYYLVIIAVVIFLVFLLIGCATSLTSPPHLT
ncbi:AMP-binding protein [Pelomyxa schiedti]|nr:AMP-binding protein [Pelomyxa schiedti]